MTESHAPGALILQLQDTHQPHETGYQTANNMQPWPDMIKELECKTTKKDFNFMQNYEKRDKVHHLVFGCEVIESDGFYRSPC